MGSGLPITVGRRMKGQGPLDPHLNSVPRKESLVDQSQTGKEIEAWADAAMFKAQEIDRTAGPQVFLLSCNHDPLGSVAAAAKAYKGEFVESLAQITDEERRYYLGEIRKTALAMPLEAVNFQFRITGVTRGFTHQMVRQRTAAYSQESTRFAVKEDVPVGLPPSLADTIPWSEWYKKCERELYPNGLGNTNLEALQADPSLYERMKQVHEYAQQQASPEQIWRREWDEEVENISTTYNALVNMGMPAEDARGILPTNLLTQINYHTNLRNFIDEGGKRLCTQAQFEWRVVFSKMLAAIREYGEKQWYCIGPDNKPMDSAWQFHAIADLFRPVCYLKGSCQFNADFDRYCSIKERVEQNAAINRPSSEWGSEYDNDRTCGPNGEGYRNIEPIFPAEWLLDHASARRKAT